MGTRLRIYVFKGASPQVFEEALDGLILSQRDELLRHPLAQKDGVDFRSSSNNDVHGLYVGYLGDREHGFVVNLALRLNSPWICLAIQEGSIWEYSLNRGEECLDRFSVCPEYWNEDPRFVADHQGNPDLLAAVWSLPRGNVERYLVNWQMRYLEDGTFDFKLSGKAYPTDRFSYGDICQAFDFLNALGAVDPINLDNGGKRRSFDAT